MAKIYSKNTWADEVLAGDQVYQVKNDSDEIVYNTAKIALASTIVAAGTPVDADKMNNIEDGIDALDTKLNSTGADIIKESSSSLAVGSVADGTILVRSGTSLVGKTVAEMQAILNPNSLIGGVWHKQLLVLGWKPVGPSKCAEAEELEQPTNKDTDDYWAFDKDTVEYARANVVLPQDYTGGTIYFQVQWTHPETTTNFKVAWKLDSVAIANGESLDAAFGTAVQVNDEGGTTYAQYDSLQSAAVTIAGTPAAGKRWRLRIRRVATDVTNDTLAVDAYLLGVLIWYPVE